MDPFELPEELPTGTEELSALRGAAQEAFTRLRGLVDEGQTLTDEQLAELRGIVSALATIDAALATAEEADAERAAEIAGLIAQGAGDEDADEDAPEEEPEETEEVTDEQIVEVIEAETSKELVATGSKAPAVRPGRTSFAGGQKGKKVHIPRGTGSTADVGFRMKESMVGQKPGLVGFKEIAESLAAVKKGHRPVGNISTAGAWNSLPLFGLERGSMPVIETSQDLVAAIQAATSLDNLIPPTFDPKTGSLTAAGGWCAPSEQLYDFCAVPLATDLVVVPEVNISTRGGIRWPNEPDLSGIFDSFEFFFTEPELEALPAPIKECVEIPCPDEFTEVRLNAVGWCVEAGILQTQAWPELIQWFMESITQEHFRALSRRTILDMVAGSTPISVTSASLGVSATSSVLNTFELMAINLRLNKGYARGYPIEVVAPNWLHAIIRADLAQMEGIDTKNVTDQQIDSWFSTRNIRPQFVADWQTREVGMPGNLGTLQWPGSVSVLMYPAGTWFRNLTPVIEFGVQYPRELLQINRYSRFFTEDAYAVWKRCDESLVVTMPTCVNGGYGGPITVTCNTPANEVQSLATSGSPTGGTITLTFQGQTTAPIAYNAAAAAVQSALEALSNVEAGEITAAGGALGTAPVTLTFGGRYAGANVPKITVTSALTGGTDPTAAITVTTEGGS
ncbi:putative tape measure protein [Nocardia phage NTR1]|nr:putative tape measure protein [Nocardia phage NTR1]